MAHLMKGRRHPYLFLIAASISLVAACGSPQNKTSNNGCATDSDSINTIERHLSCKDTIYISLNKKNYVPKDSFIHYTINNCSHTTVTYGQEFQIEKYVNGDWNRIDCDMGFTLVAYYISANEKADCKSRLYPLYNLQAGKYRIAKEIHTTDDATGAEKKLYIYGEFFVKTVTVQRLHKYKSL